MAGHGPNALRRVRKTTGSIGGACEEEGGALTLSPNSAHLDNGPPLKWKASSAYSIRHTEGIGGLTQSDREHLLADVKTASVF